MNYFHWRQGIPLIIMFIYVLNKYFERKINKIIGYVIIFGASIYIIYSYPKNIWVSLEWSIYLVLSYWYLIKKRDILFSITYSILSSCFGGWLYEIPYFHPIFMFYDLSCPLYIHTQILSGVFIFCMLIKQIKLNKKIIYAIIIFILSELFFYIRVNYYKQMYVDLFLLSRLGVMLLLFSFLTGLNKDVKIHE